MPLTTIWIIRHAFRGAWDQNPHTGEVTARFPTPTGLPADPPLTAYGVQQARELAALASEMDPPVIRIYSSPFYRCLQTIEPFASRLPDIPLVLDPGLGEWFGTAPWEQPKPAPSFEIAGLFSKLDIRPFSVPYASRAEMEMLQEYHDQLKNLEDQNRARIKKSQQKRSSTAINKAKKRPDLALQAYQKQLEQFEEQSRRRAESYMNIEQPPMSAPPHSILPAPWGESSTTLHDRVAYALDRIIDTNDRMLSADPKPRSIVITSHAAPIIAMGRALTGNMPDDICEKDFCTNCAGVTKFERKPGWKDRRHTRAVSWEEGDETPDIEWRGRGVGGGWHCTQNSDCRHLSGGGDRDWHFNGEESFLPLPASSRTRSDPGALEPDRPLPSVETPDKSKL